MKKQEINKFQTAEEMVSYLFDESFKVDLKANVYPTPADELKGEVLNLFTKKYLNKLNFAQQNNLFNKNYKKLMKWNTILFVGFLSQVQDNLSDEVLKEVDGFINQNWKYLINYKDVVGVLDYANITIGGVTVYLCEGGPSRAFDSDICYQGDNKSGAIFGWYSSLLFGKGSGRLLGFKNLKKVALSPYCGRVVDAFKYLNYK